MDPVQKLKADNEEQLDLLRDLWIQFSITTVDEHDKGKIIGRHHSCMSVLEDLHEYLHRKGVVNRKGLFKGEGDSVPWWEDED